MKTNRFFGAFFLLFIFQLTFTQSPATGADATAFNPTTVAVVAKNAGGGVPVGTIVAWPVATNPEDMDNWLECNGQTVSQTVYPELFALVGSRVPDLRGVFLRGYGSQSHMQNNGTNVGVTTTIHNSGPLGSVQGDAIRQIYGTIAAYGLTGWHDRNIWTSGLCGTTGRALSTGSQARTDNSGEFDFSVARVTPTSSEIRPVNVAVRYFIRAQA